MRTPGRCTNHDHCWLGNARRDVWVPVDHDFVCPVCGNPLKAPPINSLSSRGMMRAGAASLALLLVAGSAGFGMVRLLDLIAPRPGTLVVHAPGKPGGPHAPQASRLAWAAKPRPPALAPVTPPALVAAADPVTVHTSSQSVTAKAEPPPMPQSGLESTGESAAKILVAEARTNPLATPAAPPQKLTLPVSFGKPPAPEDSLAQPEQAWHRRAPQPERGTEFLPGPGEVDMAQSGSGELAVGGGLLAEGDGDDTLPRFIGTASSRHDPQSLLPQSDALRAALLVADRGARFGGHGVPAQTADDAPPAQGNTEVPASVPAGPGASFGGATGGYVVAELGASAIANLFHGNPMPTLPAERIDPAAAAQADQSANPVIRLVTLPPAPPDKLATPSYPPVYDEEDRPGEVNVKCTITVRGAPTGCTLLHEQGGRHFADAVMAWLGSGAVRYRPGIASGRIVPEARHYHVRFEPP